MRISDWSSDVCSSDLQFVALAVPQPDRRQRDAVEAIGLDHRIMRLVEEGETLPDAGVAGQAVVADHVAGEARGAAEAGDRPARFCPQHRGAIGGLDPAGHQACGGDSGEDRKSVREGKSVAERVTYA